MTDLTFDLSEAYSFKTSNSEMSKFLKKYLNESKATWLNHGNYRITFMWSNNLTTGVCLLCSTS